VREKRTTDDYRAMWDTIERLWAETVARAGRLPEPALHQRVDDEWSFVETLRHLILATDKWVGHMILNKPMPYHRLGLPQPGYTTADAAALGTDPDVRPPLAEVLEVRGVVMKEECEHRRYAVRDLAILETDLDDPPTRTGSLVNSQDNPEPSW